MAAPDFREGNMDAWHRGCFEPPLLGRVPNADSGKKIIEE
jgi:hypothetical protein